MVDKKICQQKSEKEKLSLEIFYSFSEMRQLVVRLFAVFFLDVSRVNEPGRTL